MLSLGGGEQKYDFKKTTTKGKAPTDCGQSSSVSLVLDLFTHIALMAFQQKSISTEEKQCSISFRICSPTVGRKGLSQDLRDAVRVSLYTNKGEKSDCSNYGGITAVHCRQNLVLLNRLILMRAQENSSESHCGFRSNRGT